MTIDKQQKRSKHDQPDFVDIGGDRDDSWVCDGVFDMWVKTPSNKWGYRPDKPSKRK